MITDLFFPMELLVISISAKACKHFYEYSLRLLPTITSATDTRVTSIICLRVQTTWRKAPSTKHGVEAA